MLNAGNEKSGNSDSVFIPLQCGNIYHMGHIYTVKFNKSQIYKTQ